MPTAKIKLDLENTSLPDRLNAGRTLAELIAAKPLGFTKAKARLTAFLASSETTATLFDQRADLLAQAAGITPHLNTADAAFKASYSKLASDIEDDTSNDEGEIKGIGLSVRAIGGATEAMPQVENLHVSDGDGTDEVDLTWNAVRSASRRN